MPEVTVLFWDLGGVLLSNAWDHGERKRAFTQFGLDSQEFETRHELVVSSFERGKITLDQYLDRTLFYDPRPFTREAFRDFMFSCSQPNSAALEFARRLAATNRYLMTTLNNESRELNDYRIEKFGLKRIFDLFVSSCFVGLRKPEAEIYRLALDLTQREPHECCFIDDRALNLECAAQLGMRTIRMQTVEQLRGDLKALGVTAE